MQPRSFKIEVKSHHAFAEPSQESRGVREKL
jgi:hypothetical protein